jgi:hypothetical protein
MNTITGKTIQVANGSGSDFSSLTDNGSGNTGHTFNADFSPSDYLSMTAIEITGVLAASLDTGSVANGSDTTSPYTISSNTFAQADELVILSNEAYRTTPNPLFALRP